MARAAILALTFETRGPDVVITLRDHGRLFAPEEVLAPDMSVPLTKRRVGGLGMHLMYQLMDEVQFDFTEDSNTLVMVKRDALTSLSAEAADSAGRGDRVYSE